ncbi:MAG TPA: MucB/RseB C-terminal domain-containing protein, partial [Orrella sp.]
GMRTGVVAHAQSVKPSDVGDVSDASDTQTVQAMQMLERAQQAAKTLNYEGTFAHQRDGQMSAFTVTHRFSDGQEQERLEVLNSSPREYLRINDRVQCVIAQQRLIVTERQQHERFPAVLMDDGQDLSGHYQMMLSDRLSRVAGRACQPLSIVPKDEHRVRYELCIDEQTGLLLEAQIRDTNGAVLEHMAFHQVQIGHPITDAQLQPAWDVTGWQVVDLQPSQADFQALGWFYREPPGYRPVAELERQFRDGRTVKQLILTDGLATISIFIEPYQSDLSHHQMAGAKSSGAVNLFGKRYGGHWVMVAGEAPAATVENLARSIVKTGVLHNK